MFLSVFDIFKIGVGPSSSHTMGPMVAGGRFLDMLRDQPFRPHGLRASLHGSLAFTGKGHATDRATILGLAGFLPETMNAEAAEAVLAAMRAHAHGRAAARIGSVTEDPHQFVQMATRFGGRRVVDWLSGEQLPRIC